MPPSSAEWSAEERLKVKSGLRANLQPEVLASLDRQWRAAKKPAFLFDNREQKVRKLLMLELALAHGRSEGEATTSPETNWQEWKNVENTDDMIGAKGFALAQPVAIAALGVVQGLDDHLQRSNGGLDNEARHLSILEVTWWLLFTADLIAFNVVGKEKRDLFMDGLLDVISGLTWATSEALMGLMDYEAYNDSFHEQAGVRAREYAKCFQADDMADAWKDGELDYELFKKLNAICGDRLSKLLGIVAVKGLMTHAIKSLKEKELLLAGRDSTGG